MALHQDRKPHLIHTILHTHDVETQGGGIYPSHGYLSFDGEWNCVHKIDTLLPHSAHTLVASFSPLLPSLPPEFQRLYQRTCSFHHCLVHSSGPRVEKNPIKMKNKFDVLCIGLLTYSFGWRSGASTSLSQ